MENVQRGKKHVLVILRSGAPRSPGSEHYVVPILWGSRIDFIGDRIFCVRNLAWVGTTSLLSQSRVTSGVFRIGCARVTISNWTYKGIPKCVLEMNLDKGTTYGLTHYRSSIYREILGTIGENRNQRNIELYGVSLYIIHESCIQVRRSGAIAVCDAVRDPTGSHRYALVNTVLRWSCRTSLAVTGLTVWGLGICERSRNIYINKKKDVELNKIHVNYFILTFHT